MQPTPLSDSRLDWPEGRLRTVIDTDTFNEVDDQFAVVHALLSPERFDVEALHAAPFHNERSTGPADGMRKSVEELHRLLDRLPMARKPPVLAGSERWLGAERAPVASATASDLIARAMDGEGTLSVVAIGAITNVASALLLEPRISERIRILWLGGNPVEEGRSAHEFNLKQDPEAARVVLDSGAPLILFPCENVASHLLTCVPELETSLGRVNPLASFLIDRVQEYSADHFAWTKEIWDLAPGAWLLAPRSVPTRVVPAPRLREDLTWDCSDRTRHPIRVATMLWRNAVFADLFRKLRALA